MRLNLFTAVSSEVVLVDYNHRIGPGNRPQPNRGSIKIPLPPSLELNQNHVSLQTAGANNNQPSTLFYVAIFVVGLNSIALGSVLGYASPMIPDINGMRAPYHLTDTTSVSWTASINAIGQAIGCAIVGYPLDVFGRKRVILTATLPVVVGWIVIIASTDVTCLLVGRFITGLAVGYVPIAIPIYLAEISPAFIRGRICSMGPAFMNLGVLYVAIFGCFLHYNWLAIACAAVPAVMVCIFVHLPDTPRWLLSNGYEEAARESLTRLRTEDADVALELKELAASMSSQSKSGITFADFLKPNVYKPLLIMITLIWFQMFSGYGVVFVYSVSIFASAHLPLSPYIQSCLLSFTGLMAQFLSAAIVDRFGRKALLSASAIIMCAAMSALGIFYFIKEEYPATFEATSITWLNVLSLLTYIFGLGLGFAPIPIYIGSEMFPGPMKGALCSIALFFWSVFFFVTTKFFLPLKYVIHDYGVYWAFAAIAASSLLFIKFGMYETSGKSLEEVQNMFKKDSDKASPSSTSAA